MLRQANGDNNLNFTQVLLYPFSFSILKLVQMHVFIDQRKLKFAFLLKCNFLIFWTQLLLLMLIGETIHHLLHAPLIA